MTTPAIQLTPSVPGHIINSSANIQAAMFMIVNYLQSTYQLQAADTLLEQGITNAEAAQVQAFETSLTATSGNTAYNPNATNYIWQLEHLPTTDANGNPDPNYQTDMGALTQLYTNANMQNQSITKVMDGNNSTAQNTLSQNSQGQQGLMQTMSAINQQQANLARDIQG